MSVNPDGMRAGDGAPVEFVDLEHQVIRQKSNVTSGSAVIELLPGDPAAEFDPGERSLDREEIAQLVVYRRSATVNWLQTDALNQLEGGGDFFGIVDASVGINGDLFREVTTQQSFQVGPDNQTVLVDTGGEIGLLDNYQIFSQPPARFDTSNGGAGLGGIADRADLTVNFFEYPTGGPIVDSFDTITCGFGAGFNHTTNIDVECQFELRYDFWWDVREQGRSTNPFGRPSTR
jgi:hypothetical protein